MIAKWEYVLIETIPTVPRLYLERYLGFYEAQIFLKWHKDNGFQTLKNHFGDPHYLISHIEEWEKTIRCTPEKPNFNRPDYRDHDFEFSHEIESSDHGDEYWRCKNCGKLWRKEGPDS